jgi:hypothetical protein
MQGEPEDVQARQREERPAGPECGGAAYPGPPGFTLAVT